MNVLDQVKAIARAEAERVIAETLRDVTPRMGTVTAGAPLTVRFWGDDPASAGTSAVARDAGYAPAVGDDVWLVKVGARWLVAGKVV